MQNMRSTTLRKCHEAVTLVYEKEYTLKRAAKAVGISSQTIYTYRDDYLSEAEKVLLNSISKRNASKK